jgi:hypothetical protein
LTTYLDWPIVVPILFLFEIDGSITVAVELTANWAPLERLLTPVQCAEFMWMYREDGIEHYKHIVSRRYLLLDREGRCLARTGDGLREVPFEQEWRRVTGRAGGSERHGDENGSTDRRETHSLRAGGDEDGVETAR